MENKQLVLSSCINLFCHSSGKIDVFDLLYETGLEYSDLQKALTTLTEGGEIEQIDDKTFKLTDKERYVKAKTNEKTILPPPKEDVCLFEDDEEYYRRIREEAISKFLELEREDDPDYDGELVDDDYVKSLEYCIKENSASVNMLQRHFPIGFVKACKIIDWMENMNYITPLDGSKPRKVLITKSEFEEYYGDKLFDYVEYDEEEGLSGVKRVACWTEEPFMYDRNDGQARDRYLRDRIEDVVRIDENVTRLDAIKLLKILRKINKLRGNDEMFKLIVKHLLNISDEEYNLMKKKIFG